MSFVMSQPQNVDPTTTSSELSFQSSSSQISSDNQKLGTPIKQVTDMDEQCEDVGESEESNSSKYNSYHWFFS